MATRKSKIDRVMERLAGWSPGTSVLDVLRAGKMLTARRALQVSTRRRSTFAAAFATRATACYWDGIQVDYGRNWAPPAPFIEPDRRILTSDATWLADAIGRAAMRVDPVTAGYFIGTTYAAALPPEVRARLGVYYTPPAVATRILDQVTAAGLDWNTCRALDPACGGGAFLAPVALRIVKQLSHLEPEALLDAVAGRVRGFEIDPVAAWMSQVFLEATLLPTCRFVGRRLPRVVDVCDSLTEPPRDNPYDLVIGNPPYGRVTLTPELRARYASSLYGHANLYGVFTELALRWVRPGGLVAYVTPTSFLAGEYFKNLRNLLAHDAVPVAVDFIAHRKGVFDDVLQEALLATYRRGGTPGKAIVHCATSLDEATVQVVAIGAFTLPDPPDQPWLLPRSATQAALIDRLQHMPHRLADWGYTVSTGPLVWNRHKNQLRRVPGPRCLPLIWAEAVTDGRFVWRADKANHQPFFQPRSRDDWLVTTQSCVLLQRTTAKEQSRRLIAAVLPARLLTQHGGAVVENHLNMVRPIGPSPAVEPGTVAAFLNTAISDQAFRCLSGSVAVSAYELKALPLPPPESLSEVSRALERKASRETIDRIAARLYGVAVVDA